MQKKMTANPLLLKIALPALMLTGAAVWLTGNSRADEAVATLSRPALTVRTTALREEKWARSLAANGSIIPWHEAIISAQVQGLRISEVKVSIGDHVQQGDVLVLLDNVSRTGNEPGSAYSAQGRIVAPDSGGISAANAHLRSLPPSPS